MLGETLGDESEDVPGGRGCNQTVTLGRACAEQGGDCRVRLEVGDNRAEVCAQLAEVEIEVNVRLAAWVVRGELSIRANRADTFSVADAGATRHVLQGIVDTKDGKIQQLGAVFDCRLLIIFRGEFEFTCHCGISVKSEL